DVIVKYIIDRTAPDKVNKLTPTSEGGYVELDWDESKNDDVAFYKLYRAEITDGVFVCIAGNINSRNYYDVDVEPGHTYMYKIAACDIAGNVGEYSDIATVTTVSDTTKPVIKGVLPQNGSTVGKNSVIEVVVIDNANMDCVDFEYLTEDKIWIKYDSKKVDSRGGAIESKLQFDNLPENTYSIRIRALDAAGNYSEYYYVDYTLDNTAPDVSVSAETGDYNIVLSISADDDYEYMEIYRHIFESEEEYEKIAQIEEKEYTDKCIEPHINYEYMVRIYDGYGNYKDSETVVCYADDNDIIAPVAILPEHAKVQAGFEILLDGGESYDNIGIVSYVWDMGNGDILTGPYPRYIYDIEGTYNIKLTVTDASGNANTAVCETEVISTDGTGTVEITVMDSTGTVIPYALVYMNDSEDEANCYKTDANGRVSISAKAGEYKAAAYKQGYLPKDIDVEVNEYTNLSYNIIINKGDIVVGEIKAHRMSLQEMVDAGVDFSNPANYHNFVFTVTLEFAERPIPIEFEYVGGGGSFSDGGNGGGFGVKYKGGQPGGGEPDAPKISIKPVEVKTEVGPVEIPLITYIKTTQSVSWLKDMYMVELGVLNMADSGYTIKDSYAFLDMPKGLSLAAIKKGQSQSQYMGDIKGQEKKFTSWVVKVDEPGEYKVTADFSGTLMPFEAPVNAHFDSEAYISSGGYEGLDITVMPESTAYTGEQYYIQFKIENNSGRPLYNFSTSFGPYTEPGVKYESYILDPDTGEKELYESYDTGTRFYPEMSEYHYTPVIRGGEKVNIRTLDDGQVIYGTYVTGFPGTADPTEYYYELVKHMVEVIDGENLGVGVYVKPISGHINKEIFCFMPRESIFGDPVDMSTGAYVDEYEALSITGVAELTLDLAYNSRLGEDAGELGFGWSHNFESYISDDYGMLHLYTSPSCCASFIDEESYNGNIYGHIEDGVLIPAEADNSKEMVYRCITTGMEDSTITRKADGTYILNMPSGDVFTYDENGKLSGMEMSDKSKVDIIHTGNQTIVTEEGSGNRLILDYSDGRLISVADDAGRKTTFAYTDGYLTTITNPLGENLNYEYDDKGRIISAKNNYDKIFVENVYDEEGRVIKQFDFEGNEITMSYTEKEDGGMIVTAADTDGAVTTYETDAACRVIKTTNPDGSSISNTYDLKGNLVSVSDEQGNAVSYTYDEYNRNTGISSNVGLNISYTYNEKDEISAVSDGSETTYMSYDESGNIISVRKADKQVSYTYDDKGRLSSMTRDGKGTEKFDYNDDRFLVSSITNELGNSVKLDYDQRGNIIRRITPEGEVTGYDYDLIDRLTAITYANGSVRRITYDIYGNPTSITDGRGNTISYEYNTAGKLIKICYPDGTSEGYEYNARGELASLTGVDGRKISYEYDLSGNLTKINYPDGTSESYEYGIQGLPTTITGRDGKNRTLSYLSDGKLSSMKLTGDSTYEINYDGNNHISLLTDEDGNTVSYTYDNYGNLSKVTDELGYVTKYEYNCWDELLGVTDANGNMISYEYDMAGCVTAMIYPDGTRMDISYDKNGRILKVSTDVTEGETRTVGISYTYDEMGNIKTYTDEMGTVTSYEYDMDGNLTKVLDDEGKVCAEYEYDCMDRLISEKSRDGSKATYKYDICGNVIQASVTTASGEVKTYAYTYDEDSVLTAVEDPTGIKTSQSRDKLGYITDITYPEGGGISYTYDDMHRLTKETLSIGTEYSYEYN
ncbi:MAG: PKD domain-containing protein, partial [Lachnospiraceae bacterium]|nr:PKD domain-containing protein [Lachnospiraceae bacterium]